MKTEGLSINLATVRHEFDLKSGVEIQGSASSPAKWNGVPEPMRARDAGSRSFHLGGSPIVVHLSTVNGPIEIRAPRRRSPGGEI